jgi:hypothetical protein
VPQHCAAVAEHENAADEVTREVMQLVRRSFITPVRPGRHQDLIARWTTPSTRCTRPRRSPTCFEQRTFQPDMQRLAR